METPQSPKLEDLRPSHESRGDSGREYLRKLVCTTLTIGAFFLQHTTTTVNAASLQTGEGIQSEDNTLPELINGPSTTVSFDIKRDVNGVFKGKRVRTLPITTQQIIQAAYGKEIQQRKVHCSSFLSVERKTNRVVESTEFCNYELIEFISSTGRYRYIAMFYYSKSGPGYILLGRYDSKLRRYHPNTSYTFELGANSFKWAQKYNPNEIILDSLEQRAFRNFFDNLDNGWPFR